MYEVQVINLIYIFQKMYQKSPSKIWRKRKNIYNLIGSKSKKTGNVFYPPIRFEQEVNNIDFEEFEFVQKAKLVTWSIVRSAPAGFENFVPYVVAILELENGEKLTSQIVDVDVESLGKGDILYPTFRKIFEDGNAGVIQYGLKWTK